MTPDEKLSFNETVLLCYDDLSFRTEFNRLTGCSLGVDQTSPDHLIRISSGQREKELARFIVFVKETVWDRLPTLTSKPK